MSELELYISKNTGCYHYDKLENPIIKSIDYKEGEEKKLKTEANLLLMVLKGGGKMSFRQFVNRTLEGGDMLLLPLNTQLQFSVAEDTTVLVFRLLPSVHFCEHSSLEALFEKGEKKKKIRPVVMKMNSRIDLYAQNLCSYLSDGLHCHYLLELKMKELFYILRAYHTRSDMVALFSPMITENADFYDFVLKNYTTVKTLKEFAEKAQCSITSFEKRFKRNFGMSAPKWLKEQMKTNLFHEITCTRKTFREISKQFGFSSSAHLSNFCKQQFGINPKILRKEGTECLKK